MNRRHFLRGLIASVPTIVAGEELLELLEPARTIILPPPGGWPAGAGLRWHTNTLGGYLYAHELSKVMRQEVARLASFRQFTDAPLARVDPLKTWDVFADAPPSSL